MNRHNQRLMGSPDISAEFGFRYDQPNLALLCQDWPVDAAEYHAQNSLYGYNSLLKAYADLPAAEPLPWAMEHAISFDNPEPYFAEADSCLPIILAITEPQAGILRGQVRDKRVEAIGSAFYYMEMVYRERHPEAPPSWDQRRGTIVFPDKSTRNQDTDYDRTQFARHLADLPNEYQPVVVSIFWRDFERGTHQPFADAGLQLVTSGSPYDHEFLFRQLDLCEKFKYSCANDLSTSFCLSILAGCHFFHRPTGPLQVTRDGETQFFEKEPTLHLSGKAECIESSPFPPIDNRDRQLELAERFSGKSSVRPPEFFREMAEKGHRLLREMTPVSVSLGMVQSLDHLSQWQPRAIDNDGWGQERCGFVVPASGESTGVRVKLHVPVRPDPFWHAVWSMTLDGEETYHFLVSAGDLELEIPRSKTGERRTVLFQASDEIQLLNEARRRCFRVTDIEWLDKLNDPLFSWALRKDEDGILAPLHSPGSIEFENEDVPFPDRSRWVLEGVTARGWVSSHCALTVPCQADYAGVRLKLRPKKQPDPDWSGRMTVTFDGQAGAESEAGLGSLYLDIPCRADGRPRRVEITLRRSPDCDPGPDGDHKPGFRIKRIEWRESLAHRKAEANLPPRLLRLEELKEIAIRSRSRKPSLGGKLAALFNSPRR